MMDDIYANSYRFCDHLDFFQPLKKSFMNFK